MLDRTPSSSGVFDRDGIKYVFSIDDSRGDDTDFWVVWGGLPSEKIIDVSRCRSGGLIYITDEAFPEAVYPTSFLQQFDVVVTSRNDICLRNVHRTYEWLTWHLGRSLDELLIDDFPSKTKSISIVASDLTWLAGHKKRFAFVNKLIGHFKDRLDIFGRGFNYIENKWDALHPYKYSIAIENNAIDNYLTEKITECFLANTYPIYFGAPNASDYYDEASFARIDINDFEGSIRIIENLLDSNVYEESKVLLHAQKMKYLEKFDFFPSLLAFLSSSEMQSVTQNRLVRRRVRNIHTFQRHFFVKSFLRRLYKRI